jgi:hypothetical protein
MPALFPSMVAPESFQVGECVRKFITDWNVTPYTGVVTQVVPKTYKVWVQWPIGISPEDPETLVKVNPAISGLPTTLVDYGYDSYEKSHSEQEHGQALPKRPDMTRPVPMPMQITASGKMAIRVAHTFASDVIGKLVMDICDYQKNGCSDVQTYNRIFSKYGSICSDHIIKSSIERVFKADKE